MTIIASVAEIDAALLERLEADTVGLELSYFSYPKNLETKGLKARIKRHQDLLRNFKREKTMHGAFYNLNISAREPMILDVCRFRIGQSIEIAQELEMDKIVFHTSYSHSNRPGHQDFWTNRQVDFWGEFIPRLEKTGISIFLENTTEENASYINGVLNRLNHPQIKTCYDTGHSNCFTRSKIRPVEWVKAYQQNLGYIHLHSNNGQIDEHIAFTEGNVDFEGFFEAVLALNPLPVLNIEVKTRKDYLMSVKALKKMGIIK